MMKNRILVTLLYFGICQLQFNWSHLVPTNLELVQVVFRHGARTPNKCESKFMPQFNINNYENDYGQLVNGGKLQMYKLGQMLRKRYNAFLTDKYRSGDVYGLSTAVSRTQESLQLVLAGLYPPNGSTVWNKNLNWIPIHVHSIPKTLDNVFNLRYCPRFKKEFEELYNSTEIKNIISTFQETFETLEAIYGSSLNINKIICAYNIIQVHRNLNMSLPEWYSEERFGTITEATKLFLDTQSYTPSLMRLNSGMLVRRLGENMNKFSSSSGRKKIYLYSAHDHTLYSLAKTLDLRLPNVIPDYASAIILEKLRDAENNYYVKVMYWSGEPKKLVSLRLKSCAENCPMNQYLENVKPILSSDDEARCLFENLSARDLENILNPDVDESD